MIIFIFKFFDRFWKANRSPTEELTLTSENLHIQCEAKKAASNVAVESVDIAAASSKIHRPKMGIRKVSGVKRIKKKQPPRRQKKPAKGEVHSLRSHLEKTYRNQKYRDQTELDILLQLLDRTVNEPVKIEKFAFFLHSFASI